MTGDVPGEIAAAAVPPAVRVRFGRQAGALAVIRQHAVGLEREQVLSIELLRVFERPARQADGAQGESAGPEDDALAVPCSGFARSGKGKPSEQRHGARAKTELEGVAAGERHTEPPSGRRATGL